MTLRLFLDDVVQQAVTQFAESAEPGAQAIYRGLPINLETSNRPYYVVEDEDAPWQVMVPTPLEGHVVQISWWVRLPESCEILPGRYGYGRARATVKDDERGGSRCMIYGSDLHDAYVLRYNLPARRADALELWEPADSEQESEDDLVSATVSPDVSTDHFTEYERHGNGIRFVCQKCSAKYQISKDKLLASVMALTCRKCGHKNHLDFRPPTPTDDAN